MTCEGESQRSQLERTKPSKVPSSFPSQRYSYTQLPHRLNTFLVKGEKKKTSIGNFLFAFVLLSFILTVQELWLATVQQAQKPFDPVTEDALSGVSSG